MDLSRAMKGHQSARPGSVTWLTPPALLAALGPFDLDPCAFPEPRPWPTAAVHYAPPRDGLLLPWRGRAWINPPFGSQADPWLAKAAQHGNAIVLVPAATETERWFRWIWPLAQAVCFLHGRPYFHRPDGSRAGANSGCAITLVAYGKHNGMSLERSGLGQTVWL